MVSDIFLALVFSKLANLQLVFYLMLDRPPDSVVFVIGATGVGKTKLALDLAQQLNGEIVGADSIQIYKGFDVASAKPTRQEMALVVLRWPPRR